MELTNILLTQELRFWESLDSQARQFHIFDLVKNLQERYKFLESPIKSEDFDLRSGITFKNGTFGGKFNIERFSLHENGAFCETRTLSQYNDEFLDDLVEWLTSTFLMKLVSRENTPSRLYLSSLEIKLNINMNHPLAHLNSISKSVNSALESYGIKAPAYGLTGLHFHYDYLNTPYPRPTSFTIERRENIHHHENLYLSNAPLKTLDHMSMLKILESTYKQ